MSKGANTQFYSRTCFVSMLMLDEEPIGRMTRTEPTSKKCSGWCFFTYEDTQHSDSEVPAERVPLSEFVSQHPEVLPYLNAPVGTDLLLTRDGRGFVCADGSALPTPPPPPAFSKSIQTPSIVELPERLRCSMGELEISPGEKSGGSSRCFSLKDVPFNGQNVELVVKVDAAHFDSAATTRHIEHVWQTLKDRYTELLHQATPLIDEAIRDFWGIPDEAPPAATELLESGELRSIFINGTPESDSTHHIHVFDRGDLIGGHDLFIELDDTFAPVEARFDG